MKKKILLGPFVGEFGWEYSFFSGYVNRLAAEIGDRVEIHVASYQGREAFYTENTVFHGHPDWFSALRISHNAYIADQWIGKWPRIADGERYVSDVEMHYQNLRKHYEEMYGPFDRVLSPAQLFRCPLDSRRVWGTYLSPWTKMGPAALTVPIEPAVQTWRTLHPSRRGRELFEKRFPELSDPNRRAISVFPRRRHGRRPDKNWGEENYRALIRKLVESHPDMSILMVGAPGGCYFDDVEMPDGVLDLIHLPERARFDLHLSALQRSKFAVGGLSGALLVALGSKTPVIEWGWPIHMKETRRQNWLGTNLTYIADNAPAIDLVYTIVEEALTRGEVEDTTVVTDEKKENISEKNTVLTLRKRLWYRVFRALNGASFKLHSMTMPIAHI